MQNADEPSAGTSPAVNTKRRENWLRGFAELCAETVFEYVFTWADRIVLRLTWKKELSRMKWSLRTMQDRMEEAERISAVSHECYVKNLHNLDEAHRLIRDLRHRLSEVGRAASQRRVKLP